MPQKTPVDYLYDSRDKFTIIGLTGLAGSGCSRLAEIMTNPTFYDDEQCVRKPDAIPFQCTTHVTNIFPKEEKLNIASTSQLIFKREYTICHNFVSANYKKYQLIKYTRVVLLYILLYTIEKREIDNADDLKRAIVELIEEKFKPSVDRDEVYKIEMHYEEGVPYIHEELDRIEWGALFKSLKPLKELNIIDCIAKAHAEHPVHEKVSNYFFQNEEFLTFANTICKNFYKRDYYCLCFMFHRIACCIRNWGDPYTDSLYNFNNVNEEYSHLYDIVKLINFIIKGQSENRRFVIDSIRNSIEAQYFKERYTAFYMIAVHDDEHRIEHFKKKVVESVAEIPEQQQQNKTKIDLMYRSLMTLMNIEVGNDDFEKGKFHAPNVGQCIADAEIHIANVVGLNPDSTSFYTMGEQWMKYAALILHPGLITPSSDERCMMVAYSAKFNSGCLSRQVGACITNKHHAIRTIGWNDPPYGQVPCYLRSLNDIATPQGDVAAYCKYMYSEIEQGGKAIYDDEKHTFTEKVKEDYPDMDALKAKLHGLPMSYCFKTLQNRYEGEKNQVYTRSLHAEENAMMQMVKYGGEGLMNGIIYVTASPCELCSKKLYQIGVRKIVYIDPYPGIARQHIISIGFKRPALQQYVGVYGSTFYKLYQPFMNYKDEIGIRLGSDNHKYKTKGQLMKKILEKVGVEESATFTEEQFNQILEQIPEKVKN